MTEGMEPLLPSRFEIPTETITDDYTINLGEQLAASMCLILAADVELSICGNASGELQSLELVLLQDGTGGRTVTWGSGEFKWPGGTPPTLSTGANEMDILDVILDHDGVGLGTLRGADYQ